MRVLLVGKGAPERGGIPTFLALLERGLAPSHEVVLCNLAHGGPQEGSRVTAGNLRRTARDALRVWREARRCDVVHVHSAGAPLVTIARAGLLCLAGRLARCATVLHVHGGRVQLWLTTPRRRRAVRLVLGAAQAVVAVSEDGHRALAGALGPQRVRRIANGVDLTRFAPAEAAGAQRPPIVLYVGLLSPRKGVLDLVAASQEATARGAEHALWLVGGTPDEGTGEDDVRAAAAGVAQLVESRPHEAMPAVYAAADIFCLPSWWEAMPLSVLEAMASGLAVIATNVGDVPRLLNHGAAGVLVAPRDRTALAAALTELLHDSARRAALGRVARARAEREFDAASTVTAVAALYAALVPQADSSRRRPGIRRSSGKVS